MLRPRIIPSLLVSRGGLVKTRGFSEPRYVGDPINAVKIFNEKQADELIVVDIDATTLGREPDLRLIRHLAVECRMPLCYGGGVRSVRHAREVVELGVEKIALSAAVTQQPRLISDIAKEVGSQSVVVVLDVKRSAPGSAFEAWTHNGRIRTGRFMTDLIAQSQDLGAGEILVNSIERDGTMTGYDLDLAEQVRESCRIPMTILGGAGSLKDIENLIRRVGIVGAAAGSLFVFKGQLRAVLINYPSADARDEISRVAHQCA